MLLSELGHVRTELLHGPVVNEIELKLALIVQITEQAAQVCVIRSLIEPQIATVSHVRCHLLRIAQAQSVNRRVDLALFDLLVLVFLIAGA